jgi:hypothetical protein
MLVVKHGSGLRLVRQVDHAALSGDIGLAWRRPLAIPAACWSSFLEAVRHHDDGWEPEDAAPALSRGRPLDFKETPVARHVEVWRRSMDLAAARGAYPEIIVGNHARWLYTRFPRRETDEDRRIAEGFLEETRLRIEGRLEELRAAGGIAAAGTGPQALEAARKLLSFLDALSLTLLGGLPFFAATETLPLDEGEAGLSLSRTPGRGVTVSPWPFGVDRVELRSRAFDLPAESFESPEECARAMALVGPAAVGFTLDPGSLSRRPGDPL